MNNKIDNNAITNGDYRYLTITNESEEDQNKLNQFLNENNYEYEESRDALQIYANELFETTEIKPTLEKAMVRVPKDRIDKSYVVDRIADSLQHQIDLNEIMTNVGDCINSFVESDGNENE